MPTDLLALQHAYQGQEWAQLNRAEVKGFRLGARSVVNLSLLQGESWEDL